jgi:hypothetical protein
MSDCFVALREERFDSVINLNLQGGRACDVVEDPGYRVGYCVTAWVCKYMCMST